MWYVYILRCDESIYYVGMTNNIERRISEHKSKLSSYTKRFQLIELVYFETHLSENSAAKREKQIKKWSRAKKEALIRQDYELLRSLSKGN